MARNRTILYSYIRFSSYFTESSTCFQEQTNHWTWYMEIITDCENYKECIKHAQRKKALSSVWNTAKRVLTVSLESFCLLVCRNSPQWARASSFTRFLDHTRHTTVGRTSLDEWSAHRRDLYLTTHNTHNRQTSMLPVGFEPTIPAGQGSQTYALDRAATETGRLESIKHNLPRASLKNLSLSKHTCISLKSTYSATHTFSC